MKKEFDLSEHRQRFHLEPYFYCEDKVKEFIKRQEKLVQDVINGKISREEFVKRWVKLCGEELSK